MGERSAAVHVPPIRHIGQGEEMGCQLQTVSERGARPQTARYVHSDGRGHVSSSDEGSKDQVGYHRTCLIHQPSSSQLTD